MFKHFGRGLRVLDRGKKNRAPSLHLLPDRAAAELDRLFGE